ncbi:uncharacterized protein [Branchiostoma lanceolatum]|uniref:uncharacterized protein isoform X1 n=1 Tax=Branchiostoma lanceolatum TaxID=7740 RepID=UPI003455B42B
MLIIVFSYSNRAIIASGPVRQWPGPWEVHYIINPCGGCYRGLATAKNEVFSHRCSVRKRKMGKLKKTKSKAKKDTLATQDEVAEIFREIKSRQVSIQKKETEKNEKKRKQERDDPVDGIHGIKSAGTSLSCKSETANNSSSTLITSCSLYLLSLSLSLILTYILTPCSSFVRYNSRIYKIPVFSPILNMTQLKQCVSKSMGVPVSLQILTNSGKSAPKNTSVAYYVCTALQNYNMIYVDAITFDLSMKGIGGGRPSDEPDLHPGRSCGPICANCKKKVNLLKDFRHPKNWSIEIKKHLDASIKDSDCICRNCERKIRRFSLGQMPIVNKERETCVLSSFDLCEEISFKTAKSITSSDLISYVKALSCDDIDPPQSLFQQHFPLCHFHYNHSYKFFRGRHSCNSCEKRMLTSDHVKVFNFTNVNKYEAEKAGICNIDKLNNDSILCNQCYLVIRKVHTLHPPPPLSLNDMLKNLSSYEINDFASPSEFILNKVALYVCEKFIDNKALLLVEAHEMYLKLLHDNWNHICKTFCILSGERYFQFESKWLLIGLIDKLSPNIIFSKLNNTKQSLLIRSPNIDLENALHHALFSLRILQTTSPSSSNLPKQCFPSESVSSTNASDFCHISFEMNHLLRKQAERFMQKYMQHPLEINSVNFLDMVNSFDPILWNFICMVTASQSEKQAVVNCMATGSPYIDIINENDLAVKGKMTKRIFALFCLLFIVSNGQCHYPLQIIISEIVNSYSHSSELLDILNKFGICVSSDTHTRFMTGMVSILEKKGPLDSFVKDSFCTVSIDNIDVACSHAVVRPNENRSWHGTSVMSVQPKPSSLKNANFTDCFSAVKIYGDGRCFFRAIASFLDFRLLTCPRFASGIPRNPILYAVETSFADRIKREIVSFVLENTAILEKLPLAIKKSMLEGKSGSFFSSFSERSQHILESKEYPGTVEIFALAFLTKSNIVIMHQKDNTFEKGAVIPDSNFKTEFPLHLLHESNGPGHFDLLVSNTFLTTAKSIVPFDCPNVSIFSVWSEFSRKTLPPSDVILSFSEMFEPLKPTSECPHEINKPEDNKKKKFSARKEITQQNIPQPGHVNSPFFSLHQSTSYQSLSFDQFEINQSENNEYSAWCDKHFFYCLQKYVNYTKQLTSNFPGLKCKFYLEGNKQHEPSNLTYLYVLNEIADKIENVKTVVDHLFNVFGVGEKIQHLLVAGDGKIYNCLIKLKDDYGKDLDWLIPFMGDWHLLKNFQTVIMKIYWAAGLKQLAAVTHSGATHLSISRCTNFKRTHRFILQCWEGMYRHLIDVFLSFRKKSDLLIDLPCSLTSNEIIESVCRFVKESGNFESSQFDSASFVERQEILQGELGNLRSEFKSFCDIMSKKNKVFQFWHDFVHGTCLAYINLFLSIRSANWNLRVASIKHMVPLFYAFDHHMYSRLLARHIADINIFPKSILSVLQKGGFVSSLKGTAFSDVALDECHEMTINKDLKDAISNPDPNRINQLALFLPFRAEILRNVKSQIVENSHSLQKDLSKSAIFVEEQCIVKYFSKCQEVGIFHDCPEHKDLFQVFTGEKISEQQSSDLISFFEIGHTQYKDYVKGSIVQVPSTTCPMRKKQLKTFNKVKVSQLRINKANKDRQLVLICFKRLLFWSQTNNISLSDFFQEGFVGQFLELPRAISNADALPYKSNKSNATSFFRNRYPAIFSFLPPSNVQLECVILEGMFLINVSPLGSHKTFFDYALFLFRQWMLPFFESGAKEIHLLFDDPNRNGFTPKDIERQRRDTSMECDTNILSSIDNNTIKPKDWRKFLAYRPNKRTLCSYLSNTLLSIVQPFLKDNQHFVTAGGFTDDKRDMAFIVSNHTVNPYPSCRSNHEESDTRVWLHAKSTSFKNILIYSPDTDVYHIGMPLIEILGKNVWILLKYGFNSREFLHLNGLIDCFRRDPELLSIPKEKNPIIMQTLFICSGCDYVSYFVGFGKVSFMKAFYKFSNFISGGESEHTSGLLVGNSEGFFAFCRLVGTLYFNKYSSAFMEFKNPDEMFCNFAQKYSEVEHIHSKWLTEIRKRIWDRLEFEDQSLPSFDALKLHFDRCIWVCKLWSLSLEQDMDLPNIEMHGWKIEDSIIKVVWDSNENISRVKKTVEFLTRGCSCKSGCQTNRCLCHKSNNVCGPGCRCINCCNSNSVHNDFEEIDMVHEEGDLEDGDEEISEEIEADEEHDLNDSEPFLSLPSEE